ncbi:unnamed protein product [Somion occarium]|uniref:DNA polymerase delta subunit 4 n=1 Tax=Somion occarium TaxID=3059160 RepID=A0ABP1E266_9APHY
MASSRSPSLTSKGKSTPTMKQAKLKFNSVKRTNSATTLEKGKAKSKASPTSEGSRTPIIVEDSSDEETTTAEDQQGKRTTRSGGGPVLKKRKVETDKAAETKGKGKAIFKSRSSVENVSGGRTQPVEERPKLNVKDKRWKGAYAEAKEKMGGAEPIHGEHQNKIHQILRVFDLSYQYGPCIGVSRLERWNRADALGLNPPPEVSFVACMRFLSCTDLIRIVRYATSS